MATLNVSASAWAKYRLYVLIWLCCLCQIYVDAQSSRQTGGSQKNKRKPGRRSDRGEGDPNKAVWWISMLFGLCLVPPIYMFMKNVYNDPMTPTLIANMWDMFKEKMLGFLGRSKRDQLNQTSRKLE